MIRISWQCRMRRYTQKIILNNSRSINSRTQVTLLTVPRTDSWELNSFRTLAFGPSKPIQLPRLDEQNLPPACTSWFIHDRATPDRVSTNSIPNIATTQNSSSELRTSFWSDHEQTFVPLELTARDSSCKIQFQRVDAPLKLLLTYLSNPQTPNGQPSHTSESASIYLAQCDLRDLPMALQRDLPTPELVLKAGKGDIYSSSLWLGRPPTYTPLHRDPNPNLFIQIAGRKVVRLLEPKIGKDVFEIVQRLLSKQAGGGENAHSSGKFRGEEMMMGLEREILHDLIWGPPHRHNETPNEESDTLSPTDEEISRLHSQIMSCCQEAHLGMGDALFVPTGWWHSVKGVGEGVTASVNWWFR